MNDKVTDILSQDRDIDWRKIWRAPNTLSSKEKQDLNEIDFTNPKIKEAIQKDFDETKFQFPIGNKEAVNVTWEMLVYFIAQLPESDDHNRAISIPINEKESITVELNKNSELVASLQAWLAAYGYKSWDNKIDGILWLNTIKSCKNIVNQNKWYYEKKTKYTIEKISRNLGELTTDNIKDTWMNITKNMPLFTIINKDAALQLTQIKIQKQTTFNNADGTKKTKKTEEFIDLDLSGITTIDKDTVKALSNFKWFRLDLSSLTTIDKASYDILKKLEKEIKQKDTAAEVVLNKKINIIS